MTRCPVTIVNDTKHALPIRRYTVYSQETRRQHPGSFEDEFDVHQYTTSKSFSTSTSIKTQSESLSLQQEETRVARSEVTNFAVLVGELGAMFSSFYARRTKQAPPPIPARSTGRFALVGAQFGRPSLPLRLSPELPYQLLHHIHSPTRRARLLQPTTIRPES